MKKYYWYNVHVKYVNSSSEITEINIYNGFENKNITRKSIQEIPLNNEGMIKDNICCVCSLSFLGHMTKEDFLN